MSPEQKRVTKREIEELSHDAYFADRAFRAPKNQHLPELLLNALKIGAIGASVTILALLIAMES